MARRSFTLVKEDINMRFNESGSEEEDRGLAGCVVLKAQV